MSKVVRIHRHGGPEEFRVEDETVGDPGPGQVRVRHSFVGLNFVDVYHRVGQFGQDPMPFVLGVQGVGVVEAAGQGVAAPRVGERVAYVGQMGAYRDARLLPADRMVLLPADMDDAVAAAGLLRGLTSQYLLRRLYKVQPGDAVLVHAAAGGVGLILCQWAKHLGATVIGTVGSAAKAKIAAAHGCDHPIDYSREDWVARVRDITGGEGVPVVYDSVGKDTFMGSLDCLRPMGIAINYGTASGQVEPFPLQTLHKRSLVVTRPTLGTWIAKRSDLENASNEFLNLVRGGVIRVDVAARYPLADVARAHADLEGRKTTGAMVLVP
jgi:NADPH2:quinone reductase